MEQAKCVLVRDTLNHIYNFRFYANGNGFVRQQWKAVATSKPFKIKCQHKINVIVTLTQATTMKMALESNATNDVVPLMLLLPDNVRIVEFISRPNVRLHPRENKSENFISMTLVYHMESLWISVQCRKRTYVLICGSAIAWRYMSEESKCQSRESTIAVWRKHTHLMLCDIIQFASDPPQWCPPINSQTTVKQMKRESTA